MRDQLSDIKRITTISSLAMSEFETKLAELITLLEKRDYTKIPARRKLASSFIEKAILSYDDEKFGNAEKILDLVFLVIQPEKDFSNLFLYLLWKVRLDFKISGDLEDSLLLKNYKENQPRLLNALKRIFNSLSLFKAQIHKLTENFIEFEEYMNAFHSSVVQQYIANTLLLQAAKIAFKPAPLISFIFNLLAMKLLIKANIRDEDLKPHLENSLKTLSLINYFDIELMEKIVEIIQFFLQQKKYGEIDLISNKIISKISFSQVNPENYDHYLIWSLLKLNSSSKTRGTDFSIIFIKMGYCASLLRKEDFLISPSVFDLLARLIFTLDKANYPFFTLKALLLYFEMGDKHQCTRFFLNMITQGHFKLALFLLNELSFTDKIPIPQDRASKSLSKLVELTIKEIITRVLHNFDCKQDSRLTQIPVKLNLLLYISLYQLPVKDLLLYGRILAALLKQYSQKLLRLEEKSMVKEIPQIVNTIFKKNQLLTQVMSQLNEKLKRNLEGKIESNSLEISVSRLLFIFGLIYAQNFNHLPCSLLRKNLNYFSNKIVAKITRGPASNEMNPVLENVSVKFYRAVTLAGRELKAEPVLISNQFIGSLFSDLKSYKGKYLRPWAFPVQHPLTPFGPSPKRLKLG